MSVKTLGKGKSQAFCYRHFIHNYKLSQYANTNSSAMMDDAPHTSEYCSDLSVDRDVAEMRVGADERFFQRLFAPLPKNVLSTDGEWLLLRDINDECDPWELMDGE